MTVRVLEVTRISAPKGLLRGIQQPRASGDCLAHDGIDFTFTANVMAECELSGALSGCRDARIKGDVRTREKIELDAVLQVELDNGTMLELVPMMPSV
jgi:hypothetical protein